VAIVSFRTIGDTGVESADASFDFASSAKHHAETFTSELEGMARRNPPEGRWHSLAVFFHRDGITP
jgi:hypothetical protein